MGYTKLFEELIRSSIWAEDDKTRIVWITMLATKDRHHFVRGTEEWLASAARVSRSACQEALLRLSSPDTTSHCRLEEGRRIRAVPGGWFIISGEFYAAKLNQAERAEYKAEKQREYRQRNNGVKAEKKPVKRGRPLKGEREYLKALDRGDEAEADRIAAGEVRVQEASVPVVPEPVPAVVPAAEVDLPCPEVSPGGRSGVGLTETVVADSGSDTEEISLEPVPED